MNRWGAYKCKRQLWWGEPWEVTSFGFKVKMCQGELMDMGIHAYGRRAWAWTWTHYKRIGGFYDRNLTEFCSSLVGFATLIRSRN